MVVAVLIWLTYALFVGTFRSYVPVTLTSDRSGLVMETNAKVKTARRPGRAGRPIHGGSEPVALKLEIDKDKIKYIPANVEAQIRATTVFGAKFVDLVYPSDPSPQRLAAGQVIKSRNVTVEVNTVFQNLVDVLEQIDTAKLNSTLSALADGVRGQGERIGQATTDANQVLLELNPRHETIRADLRALKSFNDTYSVAAQDILTTLDAASTTSTTITSHAKQLDALLLATIGLSNSGISLLAPNQANLIKAINVLEPTTNLLLQIQPGVHLPARGRQDAAGHGRLRGARRQRQNTGAGHRAVARRRPYHYPRQPAGHRRQGRARRQTGLRLAARCRGELAGAPTDHEHRLRHRNGLAAQPRHRLPGLGQLLAGYPRGARTAEHPQPLRRARAGTDSRIRGPGLRCADLYAPDGTPLWPGLPPAPPPMAPRDPGPTPGSEPFVVPAPAQMQPTPLPPVPLPQEAAPSP